MSSVYRLYSLGQKFLKDFCWFLGYLKTLKGPFEINWPLKATKNLVILVDRMPSPRPPTASIGKAAFRILSKCNEAEEARVLKETQFRRHRPWCAKVINDNILWGNRHSLATLTIFNVHLWSLKKKYFEIYFVFCWNGCCVFVAF